MQQPHLPGFPVFKRGRQLLQGVPPGAALYPQP